MQAIPTLKGTTMKAITACCYVAAVFTTAAPVAADTAPTTPNDSPHNILVAFTVPSGPPAVIGQMVDDPTCWQVAQLLTKGAPSQVFFCITGSDLKSSVGKAVIPKGARS
jgi:hypothetical protein